MAAAERSEIGLPILNLKRPNQEVEFVHIALHNDSLLILSENTSKTFICFQVIKEFLQSESKKSAAILTNEDATGLDAAPGVSKVIGQVLTRRTVTDIDDLNELSSPYEDDSKIFIMSARSFHDNLLKGSIHTHDLSVVLILTSAQKCSHVDSEIFQILRDNSTKSRLIVIIELRLCDIHCSSELKYQLFHWEKMFKLPIFMSKDILAMNSFGEEIAVQTLSYNETEHGRKILQTLKDISAFLCDMKVTEASFRSLHKLRCVIMWGIDVLTMLGLRPGIDFVIEYIQTTFSIMANEEKDFYVTLAVHLCKTQFNHLLLLLNNSKEEMTSVVHDMLREFLPYQALCRISCAQPVKKYNEEILLENENIQELNSQQKKERIDVQLGKRSEKLIDKLKFRCIIVTKANTLAKILSKFINFVSSGKWMKSGCAVQCVSYEEEERRESVLQAVVEGTINILVTTMDLISNLSLTTFNVLVYFGFPTCYEQYYKLKKKVRGLAPKLILIYKLDCSEKYQKLLQTFNDIEHIVADKVPNYITQEDKRNVLGHIVKGTGNEVFSPYGDCGPSVSMQSSIYLISRFCEWMNRQEFSNASGQFVTDVKDTADNCVEYISRLYFPLSCNNLSMVQSAPVTVKKKTSIDLLAGRLKSRMLAALEAVKILHARGQLDCDLDIVHEVYDDANTDLVESSALEDERKGRAGTNKRKRAYEIKAPLFFKDNMPFGGEISYLYKIHFDDPMIYKHSRSYAMQNITEPEFELGILSKKPSPQIPSFQVHTYSHDVSVSLVSRGPVMLDVTTMKYIRTFHQYVFMELYKLDDETASLSQNDGYLAVPLLPIHQTDGKFDIHLSFLHNFFESLTKNKAISPDNCQHYDFLHNKIVRRLNVSANQMNYTRYYVVKVCHTMSPLSAFPDPEVASTFADYYEKRYHITIKHNQPLLLVKHLSTQVNFITPKVRQEIAREPVEMSIKSPARHIHLIPELCCILPLTVSSWALLRYLPTVVHRLETILRANEMKTRVWCEARIAYDIPGGLDTSEQNDYVACNSDPQCHSDEQLSTLVLILRALTAKSVCQQYHSEVLEVLGDAFLKLEVSLMLFLSEEDKDEWFLTIHRKHLVSNDILSTQGRRLGIPGYISISPPDLTNTSLPPGFVLSSENNRRSLNLYYHQVLGDKHVANTVEALIAAVLLSSGRNAARKLLLWLRVTDLTTDQLDACYRRLYVESGSGDDESSEDTNGLRGIRMKENISSRNSPKLSLGCALASFKHIEKELGYSFKNKHLLHQALTHESWPREISLATQSYQRMEYLGDAILDYVITRCICDRFEHLDHGDMTDFRSALVNNFTLAYLAVQLKLHQSLNYMSPMLFHLIQRFLHFLDDEKAKKGASWKTSIDAFVVSVNDVEETLVEVPKILGDIFEAVIGAVFLDSGMNLRLVWEIIQPHFTPFIDYYKSNIPRSPVRVLKETFPGKDKLSFSIARLTLSRTYRCRVHLLGYGQFEAIGRTPKIAKASVARKALQHYCNSQLKKENV